MSITNGSVMLSPNNTGGTTTPPGSPGISVGMSIVTFTRIAPLSNLTNASRRHATHGSKSVPGVPGVPGVHGVPGVPGIPWVPLAPAGPAGPTGPCGPGGPCVPVLLSSLSLSLSFLSCFTSQNSTELTKKPSKGPVLHSYFLSLVLYSL